MNAQTQTESVALHMLTALQRIHATSTDAASVDLAAAAIEYASGETAPGDEPGYAVDAAGCFEG
jgi:sugar lactone lactonase YvrE